MKPIFEGQIQHTDEGLRLVVTISVDEYYWTSLPMKLSSANEADARVEGAAMINQFRKALS